MFNEASPTNNTEFARERSPQKLVERGSVAFKERHCEILAIAAEPGNMYEPPRDIIDRLGSCWVDALGALHEASKSFARTKQGKAMVLGLQLMSHSGAFSEMPKELESKISEAVEWINDTYIEPIAEAVDKACVTWEAAERAVETPEGRSERINEAYDDAANQLRAMEHLKEQWGAETIESMAQTIERFDVESMWNYLAQNADLTAEQVLEHSDIRGVFVYDDLTLDRMEDTYDALIESGRITTRDPHAFEGMELLQHATGLYDSGYIFLNISDLLEDAQDHQCDPNVGLANTIKHESLHSFHADDLADWNGTLYEGMVEYMAEEMNRVEYQPIYGENYVGFVGYDTGDTATAAVLDAALGNESSELYKAVVLGDGSLIEKAYDSQFGAQSFSQINEMPDKSAPPRFVHFDRVDKILDQAGDRADDIVKQANERLCDDQGIIVRIENNGVKGTVLASGNFESGYANGIIHIDGKHGNRSDVYYSLPGYVDKNVSVEMNLINSVFEQQEKLGLSFETPNDVSLNQVAYNDLVRLTIEGISK